MTPLPEFCPEYGAASADDVYVYSRRYHCGSFYFQKTDGMINPEPCPNKPTTPTMTTSPEQTDLYIPAVGDLIEEFNPYSGHWSVNYIAGQPGDFYRMKIPSGFRYRKAITEPAWSLPSPPEGHKWHRPDWTADMLPEGYRPLLDGEKIDDGDEYRFDDIRWIPRPSSGSSVSKSSSHHRTKRPLPTEKSIPETYPQAVKLPDGYEIYTGPQNGKWLSGGIYRKPNGSHWYCLGELGCKVRPDGDIYAVRIAKETEPSPVSTLPEIPHGWRLVREDEKTAENAKVAKYFAGGGNWAYNNDHNGKRPVDWIARHRYIIPIPDGEWIEWKPAFGNGECPVPGRVKVEVRQRKGVVTPSMAGSGVAGPAFWVNEDCSEDIIAYRVIPQEKPAAPAVSTSEPEPKDPLAEVKKAFADGKKVEFSWPKEGVWKSAETPTWANYLQYRIAPNQDSPKPEQETQPTNTPTMASTYASDKSPVTTPEYDIPDVGTTWAFRSMTDGEPKVVKIISANQSGIYFDGKMSQGVLTPEEWGQRVKTQILSRRELKARAKNIRRLEALITSPYNYAAQSQPRKSMFRVILRPIWFRAKYVALGMTIGTVAGKAVVTKVVTEAPAVLNWITELLG